MFSETFSFLNITVILQEDAVIEKPVKEEKRSSKERGREEKLVEYREEGRPEPREKDRKEERHAEKHVKLKRSYSPVEVPRERESHQEPGERSSSVASSGSHGSHRRSPDPSPRQPEDRGEEELKIWKDLDDSVSLNKNCFCNDSNHQ